MFRPDTRLEQPATINRKDTLLTDNPVCNRDDIAMDSSHSHRFPLWLISLESSHEDSAEWVASYAKVRHALGTQFISKVAVPPNGRDGIWLTKNYMDGRNGLYRWKCLSEKNGAGYRPYELSGTVFLGWWSFLGPVTAEMNCALANSFPLREPFLSLLPGPPTSRYRHRLVSGVTPFSNGYFELLTAMSCYLSQMK